MHYGLWAKSMQLSPLKSGIIPLSVNLWPQHTEKYKWRKCIVVRLRFLLLVRWIPVWKARSIVQISVHESNECKTFPKADSYQTKVPSFFYYCSLPNEVNDLTGGNWQKWKRIFLTCHCHKIYRDEAVGLKSCKNTWKITIFVKMWNLGQYRENLIFCQ